MCNSERLQLIRGLKRDIAIKQRAIRRQRFLMIWKKDKSLYRKNIENYRDAIYLLQNRLYIHKELLKNA